MRILELYLKAFGPFTENRLDFGADGPGLCVIHGANEAGKSSALRAIHDLLYGIPAQSPDDFVHRYADMRLGARLRFDDGEELAFLRKKGVKNTIRDYDDRAPIEAGRLDELARLVPEALFRRFYGLDHEELSGGSRALLEDDGELGRSLYSASLGAGNLRAILGELDREAEELFTPRGKKKPRINERIAELGRVRSQIKQESLKPQEWVAAERAEQEAAERLTGLEHELAERRRELSRLERVRRILRPLALRRRAMERLEGVSDVPDLDADFGERLRALRERRRRGRETLETVRARIDDLAARLAALELRPELLAERDSIDRLRDRWGATGKEAADLPRREAERARLKQECDARLAALDPQARPDTLERLRGALGRSRQIRELAGEHSARDESLATALEAMERASERVDRLSSELAEMSEPAETSRLRVAVQEAERLGPVDARVAECESDRAGIEEELDRAFASLGLWQRSAEELGRTAIPETVTIDRFVSQAAALDRRLERLVEDEDENLRERRRVDEELATLRGERAIPSEADLADARGERDAIWGRIRPFLLKLGGQTGGRVGSAAPGDGEGPVLADSFETSVGRADETVDRLRREADRVARQAALVARAETLATEAEAIRAGRESLGAETTAYRRDWQSLWAQVGIEPESPAEMLAWRRRFEDWLALGEQSRRLRTRLDGEAAGRSEAVESLREALQELGQMDRVERGGRLAPILVVAREQLKRLDEQAERHRAWTQELASAGRDREQAILDHRRSEGRLGRWRDEWQVAIEGLCFSKEPRSAEALDRLDAARELFEGLREQEQLAERVEKMKDDIESFEADLAAFLRNVAPDLLDFAGPDERIRALMGQLREAQRQEDLRRGLDHDLAETTEKRAEIERSLGAAEEELSELCRQAGVEAEAELDATVRAWEATVEIRRERAAAEAQLADSGDGFSLTQLEEEAEAVDPDRLADGLAGLVEQVDALVAQRDGVRDELRSARDALRRMDGSAETAMLAATAEEIGAAIRRDVDRYLVVRLAREILDREIESYRREHQDPVLARARSFFTSLTLDAYAGLEVDHDEAGRAQLVAMGSAGREVRVDAMSTGTRDQLFLALRLATLEDSLEHSESMPLISDDILVHFDDERSLATLDVLAGLGERTQILLFTHHTRIRDQAMSLGGRARVLDL